MKLKSKSLLYVLLVSAVAGITGCKPNSSKDELDVKTNGTDLTTTVKFYTNLYDKDPENPTESKMMDEIIKRKGFYNEWTICFCYIAEKLFRTKRNEEKLKKIFDIIME